jgi:hypothetical protein
MFVTVDEGASLECEFVVASGNFNSGRLGAF